MKATKKGKKLGFRKETVTRLTGPAQEFIRGGDGTVVWTVKAPPESSLHCYSYNVNCPTDQTCHVE